MFFRYFLSIIFLSSIAPFNLSQENVKTYLEGANVNSIQEDNDEVWIATYGQGIYKYSKNDDTWENYSTKEGNLTNDLFFNIAVSKNYIWAGATEGLYILNRKSNTWVNKKFAMGGEMGNWIRSLCYDSTQNVLWIGRFKNLTRLDVRQQKYTDFNKTINGDSKTNNFTTISLDGDSLVWFGTEGGVHKYYKKRNINSPNAWDFYNNKNGRFLEQGSFVSISDLLFDNKYIWFGTDEFITKEQPDFNLGGIFIFDRKRNWVRISKKDGLPANGIYSITKTGNIIWASVYQFSKDDRAEYGHGLVLIDRISGQVEPINLENDKIKTSTILSLLFDGTDIWIGTDSGLFRIRIDNPLAHWSGRKEPLKSGKTTKQKRK